MVNGMALPHMPTSYTTRKNIYEAAIVRRRNHENDFREQWQDSARYFHKSDVETAKQSAWMSDRSFNDSMQSYKSQFVRENKALNLKRRRLKLEDLLKKEKDQHEAELKGLSSDNYSRLEEMKSRSESLKSAREEKRKEIAEEKLVEHFRKNNPDLRELEMRQHEQYVIDEWGGQVEEKKEKEEEEILEKMEFERKAEEERQLAIKEDQKRVDDKFKEERKIKGVLKEQIEELKEREKEAEELKAQQEALQKQQWELEQLEEQRKFREEQRKKLEFGRVLLRQHKASLMRKSRQIQEELELDHQLLASLLQQKQDDIEIKTARREKAHADAAWMKQVIEDQLKLEKAREAELDMLYQDEAARVWQKRESEWQRERQARERLMKEVLEGRQGQIEDKIAEVRQQQEDSMERREELVRELEMGRQMTRREQEEEERAKKERKYHLEAQMTARQEREDAAMRRLHQDLAEERQAEQDYDEMLRREAERMNLRGFQPSNKGKGPSQGSSRRQAWN